MAKKQRFTSVGDAAAFLAGDDAVKNEVEEEVENSRIVNNFLQLRVSKGVTQRELAGRMGCVIQAKYPVWRPVMICSLKRKMFCSIFPPWM